MNYFLIAGEASGDMHAAALIEHIRRLDPQAVFHGLGGDRMAAAKCHLYQDYRKMAFMGFTAVFSHLGQVRENFRIARQALLDEQPDVLILIDYPSFNLKMAAFCRKHLPKTRIIYYIPPKVWAWKRWRVHRIARLCDEVLGIFPFEPDFYAQYGYQCRYVGNPTAAELRGIHSSQFSIHNSQRMIAVLPGSRQSEVVHCLPTMLEAARRMKDCSIVVAAAPGLDDALYRPYLREGETLSRNTYDILRQAQAAVVNSGTATLETALIGCPQVAVYYIACSWFWGCLRWAQALVFKIPYFTLVNIIAGRPLIRELLANDFKADKIARELERLLNDEPYTQNMLASYEHIRNILGTRSAAETAAQYCVGLQGHDERG